MAQKPQQLKYWFDRVVVITLKRRPERLTAFREQLSKHGWPFLEPQVFEAVDGSSGRVPMPFNWKEGGGAWGCMQSHRRVLEDALMDGINSVLVLEDDACMKEGFLADLQQFLANVPENWDQLMLGGEHVGAPPRRIADGVVKCTECHRTHAYAVRGEFMRRLYQQWVSSSGHCDHFMGPLQREFNSYAPNPFLFGQSVGPSDIDGVLNPKRFWAQPLGNEPVVLLRASQDVVVELRRWGFHTGYDRDPATGYDRELERVFGTGARPVTPGSATRTLRAWIDEIQHEVCRDERLICTIWHPAVTERMVRQATNAPLFAITAHTASEAIEQLPFPAHHKLRRRQHDEVILLDVPRHVVEELRKHGFHTGYWRDPSSDIDRGLIELFDGPESERVSRLRNWINCVQAETERIPDGVVAVWHPQATADSLRQAYSGAVVVIEATTCDIALEIWKRSMQHGVESVFG